MLLWWEKIHKWLVLVSTKVSTNGVERNYSFAKGYIFFSMVGELKFQMFNNGSMGASASLYEVHVIPTKQE